MNARFATFVAVLSMTALTGCSGGFGQNVFGRGAPCGPACAASAAPRYDVGSSPCGGSDFSGSAGYAGGHGEGYGSDCGCASSYGSESYSGNDYGNFHDDQYGGAVQYQGEAYPANGWVPSQGVPQPGQYSDGGYVVPNGAGTNMTPAQPLPQPST